MGKIDELEDRIEMLEEILNDTNEFLDRMFPPNSKEEETGIILPDALVYAYQQSTGEGKNVFLMGIT